MTNMSKPWYNVRAVRAAFCAFCSDAKRKNVANRADRPWAKVRDVTR